MFVGKKVSTLYTLPNLCKDKQQRDSGPSMIFFSIGPRLCTHVLSIPPMLIPWIYHCYLANCCCSSVVIGHHSISPPFKPSVYYNSVFYILRCIPRRNLSYNTLLSRYPILYHPFSFCLLDFASHHCVDSLLSRFPRYLSRNFLSSKRNTQFWKLEVAQVKMISLRYSNAQNVFYINLFTPRNTSAVRRIFCSL